MALIKLITRTNYITIHIQFWRFAKNVLHSMDGVHVWYYRVHLPDEEIMIEYPSGLIGQLAICALGPGPNAITQNETSGKHYHPSRAVWCGVAFLTSNSPFDIFISF